MEEDRISDLSDELLCHILSFLPTKLAITTSVLSKRWTPLWKSVLTLYFSDKSFKDFHSFRYFVHSVFLLRDVKLPLRSFRLKCRKSKNFDPRDINRFVHAAVQRGLEHFDLDVCDYNLSDHTTKETVPGLFRVLNNCSTLVVLNLNKLTVYNVPHLVHLPLLKRLDLDEIDFMGPFEHFMNLVSGCPILESFHTFYVTVGLRCIDSKSEFKGFPKLVEAHICYSKQNFPFAWFYNAKFLGAYLTSPYEYPVPTFHNLTHMNLIFEAHLWPEKWKWMIQVLQHCPKLQSLTLHEEDNDDDDDDDDILPTGDIDWTEPETVPECLSSQLRKCSLQGFDDIACGLHFAEYILLNSKLLCTMTVSSNSRLDVNKKHQMLVKLSSCPKGSVTCKLLFD